MKFYVVVTRLFIHVIRLTVRVQLRQGEEIGIYIHNTFMYI